MLNYFSKAKFTTCLRYNVKFIVNGELLAEFLPNATSNFAPLFKLVQNRLMELDSGIYLENNRRHKSFSKKALHMGFYQSNTSKLAKRVWELYETTDKPTMLLLKPFLQKISEILPEFPTQATPPEYCLFQSAFTSLVVNYSPVQWHIDPKDKNFTILLYIGKFTGGEFLLGPPLNTSFQVRPFDVMLVRSSTIFHKSLESCGKRLNLSLYCKTTDLTKSDLTVPWQNLWALKK